MQDTTLFLELTRANMRRAIERSRERRPRVKVISVADRVYSVSSSSGNGDCYIVRLSAGLGRLLASCECKGAQAGAVCYHVVAAAGCATGIKQMRKAVAA
jgi:hypothetical protein